MPIKKIQGTDLASVKIPSEKEYRMDREGITQSMISNFMVCPLRGILCVNRWAHWDSKRKTVFGNCCHECLDVAYSSQKPLDVKGIDRVLDKLISSRSIFDSRTSEEEQEKTRGTVTVVLQAYFRHYAKDFTQKKFTATEETKDVALVHAGYRYRLLGKIDGEFDSKGKLWLMEHKTRGRIVEDFLLEHLSIDFQNLFYITMKEIETAREVTGVLYNIIRTPRIDADKKPLAEVLKKLEKNIAHDTDHYFKRWEVVYSAREKTRFSRELAPKLEYIRELVEGRREIYRNEFGCETPYVCEFLPACASGRLNGYIKKEKLFEELDF